MQALPVSLLPPAADDWLFSARPAAALPLPPAGSGSGDGAHDSAPPSSALPGTGRDCGGASPFASALPPPAEPRRKPQRGEPLKDPVPEPSAAAFANALPPVAGRAVPPAPAALPGVHQGVAWVNPIPTPAPATAAFLNALPPVAASDAGQRQDAGGRGEKSRPAWGRCESREGLGRVPLEGLGLGNRAPRGARRGLLFEDPMPPACAGSAAAEPVADPAAACSENPSTCDPHPATSANPSLSVPLPGRTALAGAKPLLLRPGAPEHDRSALAGRSPVSVVGSRMERDRSAPAGQSLAAPVGEPTEGDRSALAGSVHPLLASPFEGAMSGRSTVAAVGALGVRLSLDAGIGFTAAMEGIPSPDNWPADGSPAGLSLASYQSDGALAFVVFWDVKWVSSWVQW